MNLIFSMPGTKEGERGTGEEEEAENIAGLWFARGGSVPSLTL